jgi:anti-sigma factor RsiW
VHRTVGEQRDHAAQETDRLMNCKEAIEVLADFLDQVLSSEVAAALEAHLRDCAPCRAYLATYRETRGLVGEAGRIEMPAEMKARLRRFLLEQLGRNG